MVFEIGTVDVGGHLLYCRGMRACVIDFVGFPASSVFHF